MRAVLDTNILVSGLLSPYGASAEILRMLLSGDLTPVYDARIFLEYEDVLSRSKFHFDKDDVAAFLDLLKSEGEVVSAMDLGLSLLDPHDEIFLEAAVSAKCEFLITGNIKHFPLSKRQGIRVLTPADFVGFMRKKGN